LLNRIRQACRQTEGIYVRIEKLGNNKTHWFVHVKDRYERFKLKKKYQNNRTQQDEDEDEEYIDEEEEQQRQRQKQRQQQQEQERRQKQQQQQQQEQERRKVVEVSDEDEDIITINPGEIKTNIKNLVRSLNFKQGEKKKEAMNNFTGICKQYLFDSIL